MPNRIVLAVGTRKGCFLLESDEARRDWSVRGPFCDGWLVYHAVIDPDSRAIYASAASEWHRSSVARGRMACGTIQLMRTSGSAMPKSRLMPLFGNDCTIMTSFRKHKP